MLTNWRCDVGIPPLLWPLRSLGPDCAKAVVSRPHGAQWGQRRDPRSGAGPCHLLPASLPLPFPTPVAFDVLITSLSGGFIWELPELMSSPGGRACTPSRWGEGFTPQGGLCFDKCLSQWLLLPCPSLPSLAKV